MPRHKKPASEWQTSVATRNRSSPAMARLQQRFGNRALSAAMERAMIEAPSAPLAVTVDGNTTFAQEVATHPDRARIEAHEAVHRAQFEARGQRPLGSRAQLESEAARGCETLLAGGSFAPQWGAPAGAALLVGAPIAEPAVPTSPSAEPAVTLTVREQRKLAGFGPEALETSLQVLDRNVRRIKSPNATGTGRMQIQVRSTSGEIRVLMVLLRMHHVEAVRLLPGGTGGRSPDFHIRLANGSELRVEVRTLTQALRSVRHSVVQDAVGRSRQRVPKMGSIVNLRNSAVDGRNLEDAIRAKALGPNTQLKAQNKNTEIAGKQIVPRGIVIIGIDHARLNRAELAQTMRRLRGALMGDASVEAIWIHARLAGDKVRTMSRYERSRGFAIVGREPIPARGSPEIQAAIVEKPTQAAIVAKPAQGPIVEKPALGGAPVDVLRRSMARKRVGLRASGAAAVLELFNWYASLDSSELSIALSRALVGRRNELFYRMGGKRHDLLLATGQRTVFEPPTGAELIGWLLGNIPSWREFHQFWNVAARDILLSRNGEWFIRAGNGKSGEPIDVPVTAEITELFTTLDANTNKTIKEQRMTGAVVMRFRDGSSRDVWQNEGKGLQLYLSTFDTAVPHDARFFVLGETTTWRGLAVGTFLVVEGADLVTIKSMRGETGLIDPDALEPE